MKSAEPSFGVSDFLGGAKGAYEMILMGFENGDLDQIKPFISEEVYEAFLSVIAAREDQGLTVDAQFIGVRETSLMDATFDDATRNAEVTVRFIGELVYAVRNEAGEIVEGDEKQSKKQKDVWTFCTQAWARMIQIGSWSLPPNKPRPLAWASLCRGGCAAPCLG